MLILGISAFYHDSAAALVKDGQIIAAAQQERFSRLKHDARFPADAINYCLDEASCNLNDIDQVVFFEKPFIKFERLLETYVQFAPRGIRSFQRAIPLWLREKLFQKGFLKKQLAALNRGALQRDLMFSEHHLSHAASAFFPSPFDQALVLTMDGVGEWATTTASLGHGNDLQIFKEIWFPDSLGLLYSAFTTYCGFRVNSGEYKLMGLAPYGKPRYVREIADNLIDVKDDGSFRLNQDYFNYCTGLSMTSRRFHKLFGGPPRSPQSELTQRHMDLAASIQEVTEDVVLKLARSLRHETGQKNLCLAGGVALNCVANGRLLREAGFQNVWVQPAAGDAGGALGAALYAHHAFSKSPRIPDAGDAMSGAYLGPDFSQEDIENRLSIAGARFDRVESALLIEDAARRISDGQALGWFQGRMEYGPRALGARSILADPRNPRMQSTLNLKIKYRESFRPFAPAVLESRVTDWFQLDQPSPYMLMVDRVHERRLIEIQDSAGVMGFDQLTVPRSTIPAVTHVDNSARIQTVGPKNNPRFHRLLEAFERLTGCPVLVNTSFNIRGEPIVCTPEDAFRCLMGTDMDVLVIGDCRVEKSQQDKTLAVDYRSKLRPD